MAALEHLPDPFITLPFRQGKEDVPEWELCLKFISMNHSSNNTSAVEATLRRMHALHNIIVQTCRADAKVPPTETFIEQTLKPYCQLVAMAQAHLPLHGGQVHKNLIFVWRDSFDDSHKNESKNGNLELICCVYNLAASWAYVAAQQAKSGVAGDVKSAFKAFQNAAGYYEMAEHLLTRLPPEHAKGDLTLESMSLLRRMCLVMAHHSAYLKAENDMKGNHSILAKFAREGGKQYEEVASSLKASAWCKRSSRSVSAALAGQLFSTLGMVFYARSHLHLATSMQDTENVGIAIAHFEKAKSYLAQVQKLPTAELRSWISSIISNVNKEHDKAIAANESVYFVRVPKEVEAPTGLPRPLGKATEHISFTSFQSKRGEDPFFGIVPAHIVLIVSKWREKERNLVSVCNKSCVSSRTKANERWQALGVTTIIEVLSGESKNRGQVPKALCEKIQSLHAGENGATKSIVEDLVSAVKTCDELWVAINDKVQQVKAELEAEHKEDEAHVAAYGERMWHSSRRPSNEAADRLSIEAALQEYEKGLRQWFLDPFTRAKTLLEGSLRDLARLDWSMEDLDALMPFVETKESRQQSAKVLEQVDVLKHLTQRKQKVEATQEVRLRELNELIESDNVTFALSSMEASQQNSILEWASKKISDAIERANETMREEEQVMTEVEQVVNSLGVLQSSDPMMAEMQKVCNGLENACSVYTDLRQEFGDIMRYASSTLDGLESALSSAKSFVVCRKLEAEGLRATLDEQIAQKILQMQQSQENTAIINESRQRQDELRSQIESLERQREQWEPQREERMAEILRRQREMAAAFNTSVSPPTTAPANADAPPSYDSIMNASRYPSSSPPLYRPL
ncbi:programmed cell death 6-interacting protein [Trypanosoma rangeli]|uniref:Programmed cell death 6-interacting protein n=1 Tax=Trypanosoma rangeli TaxID=5698 RepID=A0A422N9P5_TRYRA|nr:programmed cell death 6-interacting protein [Trypanosoma rangeli]RNF02204.1 programmed cell death 6-interacting protein [Trypanosoma rangeli]|eukprot:RNF02204.1 programmed cell death 6-interacting protein [Trypanosoma rangeli]